MTATRVAVGDVFGKLTVLELIPGSQGGPAKARARCECGGQITTHRHSLTSGSTKSDGCIARRGRPPKQPKTEAELDARYRGLDRELNVVETGRLDAEADEWLKADARSRCRICDVRAEKHDGADHEIEPWIRASGRGFSDYARAMGLTSKKILETVYAHELAVSVAFASDQFSAGETLDHLQQQYSRTDVRITRGGLPATD